MEELYNVNGNDLGAGFGNQQMIQELIKATTAGSLTGRDLDGVITSGASLKVESLEPTLKVLTNRDEHIKFYKMLPKMKAYNTVEEYNQLVDYGGAAGIFNGEGELPQFTDSEYRRKSVLVKYTGIAGEVTHPAMLVKTTVGDLFAKEVQNKTMYLLRGVNQNLSTANSDMVANEFDGFFKQHFDGITEGSGSLDAYANSSAVIDARGSGLLDEHVEDASHAIVNDGFGSVSGILSAPIVFNDYVKQFHESKRVLVNNPLEATSGATMGQKVNTIATQFGMINITDDIYFDRRDSVAYNAGATSTKSPNEITPDGSPLTAETDTNNKFGTEFAGSYFYAVRSKNRYGMSAMTMMGTSAVTVASTQSIDLDWTITDNAYAAESFVIYRTEANEADYTSAEFYPILTISTAQLTAGYDGAASAGLARDRNRVLPNTHDAILYDNSELLWSLKQLAPLMRMDLATTAPARRFMILCYLTPVLYAPKKMARIMNIGRTFA